MRKWEPLRRGFHLSTAEELPRLLAPLAAFVMLWTGTTLGARRTWRRGAGVILIAIACRWLSTM